MRLTRARRDPSHRGLLTDRGGLTHARGGAETARWALSQVHPRALGWPRGHGRVRARRWAHPRTRGGGPAPERARTSEAHPRARRGREEGRIDNEYQGFTRARRDQRCRVGRWGGAWCTHARGGTPLDGQQRLTTLGSSAHGRTSARPCQPGGPWARPPLRAEGPSGEIAGALRGTRLTRARGDQARRAEGALHRGLTRGRRGVRHQFIRARRDQS